MRPRSRLRDGVARQARAGAPVAPERSPEAGAARVRSVRLRSPGSRACARGGRPPGAPARPRRPARALRVRDVVLAPPGRAPGRRPRDAPRGAGLPERRNTQPTRRAGGRTRSARPRRRRTSPASSAGASSTGSIVSVSGRARTAARSSASRASTGRARTRARTSASRSCGTGTRPEMSRSPPRLSSRAISIA